MTKKIIAGVTALVVIAVAAILIFTKPAVEEVVPVEEVVTITENAASEEPVG